MENIVPDKFKPGDEIRIIAPSRSLKISKTEIVESAKQRLESLGFKVTFAKNVMECDDDYKCGSIEKRVQDLHEAYLDKNVKAILTVIGGFNVNQILDYIDYDLIRNNPKILCGFSDITALANAIYAKTGVVTYSGPHFTSFAMKQGFEYTLEYFKKMFMQSEEKQNTNRVEIQSSKEYSDDCWYKNQDDREFILNEGMVVVNEGIAEGKIIGGNLCTLNLLQGTEYMPDIKDSILFLEDDNFTDDYFLLEFDRNLQSLLHFAKDKNIKGIVFGRCQKASNMDNRKWEKLIKSKKELNNIPVIIGADFGHTTPIFTFPIGGKAQIKAIKEQNSIAISKVEIEG